MKAVITLEDYSPAKVEVEIEGTKRSIYLNMQDLASFIVSSVKDDDLEDVTFVEKVEPLIVSPSLPPNTVKYSKLSDETDLVFIFYPETKANVTYHNSVFENVPFPNLVFCFGVRNGILTKKHVLAYKDKFLRDDTELYRFPYANVYNGGNMCYFSNEKVSDLVQLQTFPYRWIREPFNDHLYNLGESNKTFKPLREIFETTQNEEFDYDMLASANINFERWANSHLQ